MSDIRVAQMAVKVSSLMFSRGNSLKKNDPELGDSDWESRRMVRACGASEEATENIC